MIARLKPKSEFSRNVLTLMTGTTIAQAIPIAITPILTRLYTPDDFGIFALYIAIVSVLSAAATGRYELAVMLPKENKDADLLVILSLCLSILLSLLLLIIVKIYNKEIASILGNADIRPWLYIVPLGVALTGVYNTLNYWLNRHKYYLRMSKNRVLQSSIANTSNIGIGYLTSGSVGLILGTVLGQLITTFLLLKLFLSKKQPTTKNTIQEIKKVATRYKNHPLHLLSAHWVGAIAIQLPIFIISSGFSSAVVGYYSLVVRVVSLPSSLVAGAMGDVYREQATAKYWEKGNFRSLFLKTLSTTVKLAALPFCILYIITPDLFAIIFGEPWRIAGGYARILIIASFFQFIFTPLDKGALIVGATRYILVWHFLRLFLLIGIAIINYYFSPSIEVILWLITFSNIFVYILDGIVEYIISRGTK